MSYNYSILNDTLNGAVDLAKLHKEIKDSAIGNIFDGINTVQGSDTIEIHFISTLTTPQEADLDAIVAAHNGEALVVEPSTVEVSNAITVAETPPFATPTFRTKRDSTPTILEIAPGDTEVIDYFLAEERYVQGGELVYVNAEIGDYLTAEIYDTNAVIPEAYRADICEDWPSVAKYIFKHWINPGKAGQVIDTYPLNAKITAGLALRITYTATNAGSTRKVGLNYFLTKKL